MMKKPMMMVMMGLMILSLIYAGWGLSMHAQVDDKELDFHNFQSEYFTLDKATRDSAATGSDLNQQLVEIKNYPSELLRLKLVGVGRLLTGIYVLLFAILMALVMMPKRLAEVIGKGGKKKK